MLSDLWRDVSKRIGFFTKETNFKIPESPGIYAWFIPLWILDDDIENYINLITKFYLYDPIIESTATKSMSADFNWESSEIKLTKKVPKNILPSHNVKMQWDEMINNKNKRETFSQALMEASIFMPPLYVGKTDDLKERYYQHIEGETISNKNTFHNRFNLFAKKNDLHFKVSDLVFACIKTDTEISESLRENNLNWLLEQVVMSLCRPTFSIR